jgi:hypothetical protein
VREHEGGAVADCVLPLSLSRVAAVKERGLAVWKGCCRWSRELAGSCTANVQWNDTSATCEVALAPLPSEGLGACHQLRWDHTGHSVPGRSVSLSAYVGRLNVGDT